MTISPYFPPSSLSGLPTGIWNGVNGLPVFPYLPGQNPTVTKAPMWSTQVVRTASGRERRTAYWPYPLWRFEVSYEVLRKTGAASRPATDELFALWEFFNVAQGQFGSFLVVDPTDCQVTEAGNRIPDGVGGWATDPITGDYVTDGPWVFAVGDGVTRSFQITRRIYSFIEPVYGVYGETILDNGAAAGSYTLGPNGVITFTTAPTAGHNLSWHGWFYFGCRFLQDDLGLEQIVNQLWSGKSLKFTSLRA